MKKINIRNIMLFIRLPRPFRWLRRRMTRAHRALVREAVSFEPWDWVYILYLEKRALERMVEEFEKHGCHEGAWIDIRDMKWCISLIDIITMKTSLVEYDESAAQRWMFTRYVNIRNMRRFASEDFCRIEENPDMRPFFLEDCYCRKAWALYCKIRQDRMQNWWD